MPWIGAGPSARYSRSQSLSSQTSTQGNKNYCDSRHPLRSSGRSVSDMSVFKISNASRKKLHRRGRDRHDNSDGSDDFKCCGDGTFSSPRAYYDNGTNHADPFQLFSELDSPATSCDDKFSGLSERDLSPYFIRSMDLATPEIHHLEASSPKLQNQLRNRDLREARSLSALRNHFNSDQFPVTSKSPFGTLDEALTARTLNKENVARSPLRERRKKPPLTIDSLPNSKSFVPKQKSYPSSARNSGTSLRLSSLSSPPPCPPPSTPLPELPCTPSLSDDGGSVSRNSRTLPKLSNSKKTSVEPTIVEGTPSEWSRAVSSSSTVSSRSKASDSCLSALSHDTSLMSHASSKIGTASMHQQDTPWPSSATIVDGEATIAGRSSSPLLPLTALSLDESIQTPTTANALNLNTLALSSLPLDSKTSQPYPNLDLGGCEHTTMTSSQNTEHDFHVFGFAY